MQRQRLQQGDLLVLLEVQCAPGAMCEALAALYRRDRKLGDQDLLRFLRARQFNPKKVRKRAAADFCSPLTMVIVV
jgi:hypothetical protein